jgi:hypothetical protein
MNKTGNENQGSHNVLAKGIAKPQHIVNEFREPNPKNRKLKTSNPRRCHQRLNADAPNSKILIPKRYTGFDDDTT